MAIIAHMELLDVAQEYAIEVSQALEEIADLARLNPEKRKAVQETLVQFAAFSTSALHTRFMPQ